MSSVGNALVAGGIVTTILAIFIAVYLVFAYPLYRIAQNLGSNQANLAFIPFANIYLMLVLGEQPGWMLVLAFIPIANIVFLVVAIMAWMRICVRLGKASALGLLMLVPFANFILPWYLALTATATPQSTY